MNAILSSLRPGLISNVVSHGGRFLAGLMVFCIMINGFIPRFSIGAKDYEVLSDIMQRQSSLLRFFSFSTLPVKLVNDLFAGRGALPQSAHKKAPKHQNTNSSNTSVDHSFIGFDNKTNSGRLGVAQRISDTAKQVAGAGVSALMAAAEPMDEAPPGERFAFLALMLLCFMLPRSSVSDGHASFSFSRKTCTQLAETSWVFYLALVSKRRLV